MPGLKEVRNRIVSVNSTSQITQAMKMVSAAKLKKAQDAIQDLRPYANKLKEVLGNVTSTLNGSHGGKYTEVREVKNVLIVAVSSNRGLCGGFNANIYKGATALAAEYSYANVHMVGIGKKAADMLRRKGAQFKTASWTEHLNELFVNISFKKSAEAANHIMDEFASGNYDKVFVVYNRFKNAATQVVTVEQMLPLIADETSINTAQTEFIFEPSKQLIVEELIPKTIKIQLHKAILDSNASEHGARMTAMHKATDNAKELLKELKLNYNKARQAAITKEILEITSGAEALNG
jgi:F-type H+-transporting ATPase subunit gamma